MGAAALIEFVREDRATLSTTSLQDTTWSGGRIPEGRGCQGIDEYDSRLAHLMGKTSAIPGDARRWDGSRQPYHTKHTGCDDVA